MSFISKEVWKWNFKILDVTDYELKLIFNANHGLLMKIYKLTVLRMARSHHKSVKGNLELITEFDVDQRFYSLIKNYIKKPFNISKEEILQTHHYALVNYEIKKATFSREGKDWKINITTTGTYIKK